MFPQRTLPLLPGVALLALLPAVATAGPAFEVRPAAVTLEGNFARLQLLVTESHSAAITDRSADLTHRAHYTSSDLRVVTVSPTGRLLARGNGTATVTVRVEEVARRISVTVRGVSRNPQIGFLEQVMPVLSRAGCNAGACHASQHGKGGFKLSVFGYAPDEDFRGIVRDSLGRRVSRVDPAASLLLRKPTLAVPHKGGRRLEDGSVDYEILRHWLACGAPGPNPRAPHVTALRVLPARRVGPPGFTQQLRVLAAYDDGTERDVTALARYDSMDEGVLRVRPNGVVATVGKGQGAAMVRFEGHAEIAAFVVPYANTVDLAGWTDRNFIDRLAAAKFREIGIAPSPLCDDATFLRRAFLDVTGTLPTPAQASAFLDSKQPDKRDRLIDELLGVTGDPSRDVHNNAYAAHWALKWSDLIRSNSGVLGEQGMWALHNWITASFRDNKRLDRFVRELITARGSTFSNGPANFYRIAGSPQDLAEATAQLFLGSRLQCAKCHHHPFEHLSQDDYYSFAAFFARVGRKGSQEFGIFGNEQVILVASGGEVANPRTGRVRKPTPLHGKPAAETPDRRQALADWITARDNRLFARNIVNRYVAYLLGRGLVEPAPGNAADEQFYSHYLVKRLAAEPLLDAVDAAAGTRTKFSKVPLGTRAIELPDARYNNYFLNAFGKPRRESVCECERVSAPNLAQALHTLNGDVVSAKVADPAGRVARLLAAKKSHDDIVAELYLATLSRRPTAAEGATWQRQRAEAPNARAFYEDLLWSLINSKHFLFVR